MNINTVGKTPLESGGNYITGIGYVVLPIDIERDDYLRDCFLQGRVSLKTEEGTYFHKVPIDPWVFNFIEFPVDVNSNGTMVTWVLIPNNNHPVIVGRVLKNDELSGLSENDFKLTRKLGDNFVEISGNPSSSHLNLILNSLKGGELNISIYNKDQKGKLNINVLGDTSITSTGNTFINQNNVFTVQTSNPDDSTINSIFTQNEGENHFENEKFSINNGSEPLVLGNQMKQFLSDFIDQVSGITITTQLGQMSPLNKLQIENLKTQLDNFLSEISFTD